MLLTKSPRAATPSRGGKRRTGLPHASAPLWDIHLGRASLQRWGWSQHWLCPLLPPCGQAVRTWERRVSCGGGVCLLAQMMPARFHAGECCKKLFESTSDFWHLRLVGSRELKAEFCLHEKGLLGLCFKPATCYKMLMKGWLKLQPKFQTFPPPQA